MLELENIKYSLKNLWTRKSRSALTILSIFIGIATIFIFISFGLGLYNYINELSSQTGADKFIVQARGIGAPGADNTFKLLQKDLDTVEKTIGVDGAGGMYFSVLELSDGKVKKYTYGIATNAEPEVERLLTELNSVDIIQGRQLKKGDSGKVVLGYNYLLEKKIFERPVKLGDKLLINGEKFDVIGFLDSIGSPQDDAQVYMIDEDLKKLYPDEELGYAMIIGRVSDKTQIESIAERVEKNLRRERGLEEGKEDFFVQTFQQLIEQFSNALNIVIGFIIMIALISVLVSAVNTANTMVTSVLERTKEIGIMKAIGAQPSTIRNIFLFESSFLGFVAGMIGVLIGWILASIGGSILANLGWSFLAPYFSWQLFFGLILFATLVGTISGLTTAIKASRQNPVDSLRYE